MSKNRKLFSKKDGTTFLEDIHGISEDTKAFFHGMPDHLKKWLPEATDIVDLIQKIDDALQDGQPADTVIDLIIKNHPELKWIYEKMKGFIDEAVLDIFNAEGANMEKFLSASNALAVISDLTTIGADTVTQNAVYFYKHG